MNAQPSVALRVLAFAVALAGIASSVEAFGTLQVVATSGEAAPDGNGVYATFAAPLVNSTGQVVFGANLSGTDLGNDDNGVIFRGTPTGLTAIMREGQAAPDGNGVFRFVEDTPNKIPVDPAVNYANEFGGYSINNLGRVAFEGQLALTAGDQADDTGVYLGAGGALDRVVREGQAMPGGGVAEFVSGAKQLNDAGQTLVSITRDGTSGWYRAGDDALTLVVEDGQYIPDGDHTFDIRASVARLTQGGQVTFSDPFPPIFAPEADSAPTPPGARGVFLGTDTGPVTLVQNGATPPGLGGLMIEDVERVFTMNENADIAYEGQVEGTNDRFIVVQSAGLNEFVIRNDDLLPRSDGSTAPAHRPTLFGFNDARQVLFTASIVYGRSLFRAEGGTVDLVLERGSAAPEGDGWVSNIIPEEFNQAGQSLVFITYGDSDSGFGFLFCDDALGCQSVMRVGDTLLGGTISRFIYPAKQARDNLRNTMNDLGQVAMTVVLDDGRHAVVLWTPTVLGDADMDHVVGLSDLDIVGQHFGQAMRGWRHADFNGDGVVSLSDLDALGAHFGQSALPAGAPASVPEPATLALLALGTLGVLRRRT